MKLTLDEIWDRLLEMGIATKEEMTLVTHINGFNPESFDSIVSARTEWNDVEQLLNEEGGK